jgi:hypothetical protein
MCKSILHPMDETELCEGAVRHMRRKICSILILCFLAFLLGRTLETYASDDQCKRRELMWDTWRTDVLIRNPGTHYFELGGNGRAELLRAYKCDKETDKCPPDQVFVFHCVGNTKVLVAFVKNGCVTIAEDMLIEDYMAFVTGGRPC